MGGDLPPLCREDGDLDQLSVAEEPCLVGIF